MWATTQVNKKVRHYFGVPNGKPIALCGFIGSPPLEFVRSVRIKKCEKCSKELKGRKI